MELISPPPGLTRPYRTQPLQPMPTRSQLLRLRRGQPLRWLRWLRWLLQATVHTAVRGIFGTASMSLRKVLFYGTHHFAVPPPPHPPHAPRIHGAERHKRHHESGRWGRLVGLRVAAVVWWW